MIVIVLKGSLDRLLSYSIMAPSFDFTSTPSTGKLKLKGVKDSKVDKKKVKKKPRPEDGGEIKNEEGGFEDNLVMLKSLEDEDAAMTKEKNRQMGIVDGKEVAPGAGVEDEELGARIKTEAEKRYDEQRRKRVSCCRCGEVFVDANQETTARRSSKTGRRQDAQATR